MNIHLAMALMALAAGVIAWSAILPLLDRLPRLIGWEEETGAASAIRGSRWGRAAFTVIMAVVPVAVIVRFSLSMDALFVMSMLWLAIAIAWIDLAEHLIPECMSIPMFWLGLLVSPFCLDASDRAFGAFLGFAFVWGTMAMMGRIRQQRLVAGGDVVMAAVGGAWFGYPSIFTFLLCASVIFTVVAWVNRWLHDEDGFPMGPAFAAAFALMAFTDLPPLF